MEEKQIASQDVNSPRTVLAKRIQKSLRLSFENDEDDHQDDEVDLANSTNTNSKRAFFLPSIDLSASNDSGIASADKNNTTSNANITKSIKDEHIDLINDLEDEDDGYDDIFSQLCESDFNDKTVVPPTANRVYNFEGIPVHFPYEAYKSQKEMMERIIKGAKQGHNCLLESPTGTGKTAALLCALLAYQKWCHVNPKDISVGPDPNEKCSCGLVPDPDHPENSHVIILPKDPKKKNSKLRLSSTTLTDVSSGLLISSPVLLHRVFSGTSPTTQSPNKKTKFSDEDKNKKDEQQHLITIIKQIDEICHFCTKKNLKNLKPPKIYYLTRTHTQIAQVIKQLKNTPYKDVKMTILSSRDNSCIMKKQALEKAKLSEANVAASGQAGVVTIEFGKGNGPASPSSSSTAALSQQQSQQTQDKTNNYADPEELTIDDACSILRRNYYWNKSIKNGLELKESKKEIPKDYPKQTCPYFAPLPEIAKDFKVLFQQGAWDIEDIVKHGKSCNKCAFYGAKSLHEEAEIVFCPYNYLIYPDIRKATKINLTGNIVVFDEAHNIEDLCRQASSVKIDSSRLQKARLSFDKILIDAEKGKLIPTQLKPAIEHFSLVLTRLSIWIQDTGKDLSCPKDYEEQKFTKGISILDQDILKQFKGMGLGPETLDKHLEYYETFKKEDEGAQNQDGEPSISIPSSFTMPKSGINFVGELLHVITLLYDQLGDYYVVLTRRAKKGNEASTENFVLDILCLNPAVAFEPIKNGAHSIIVASGTLSPMKSFESELNTEFKIDLSADHVVERRQVWAGIVCFGPSGPRFELNLKSSCQKELEIQDEIGKTILEICKVVPHGVLVFLPSYSFMNALRGRWMMRGGLNKKEDPILNQISDFKIVFFEESSKDKEKFLKDMAEYKHFIKTGSEGKTGCILFGVFRGKISEGIDFADNQARAVITVGIPFAAATAYDVVAKKSYNTRINNKPQNSSTTSGFKLLDGQEWYNIQAFRAMNQGFGRCIRHKEDWGAIIMLESRLGIGGNRVRYQSYLSKWIQQFLKTHQSFDFVRRSLKEFVDNQQVVNPTDD